ncbi:MAG: 50S ribosomal protein L22 [Pirellulales bacterium]
MEFTASHRFARISPRKVRHLANLVRGKFADQALELLKYQPQRGARMLEQVIKSALGNAQDPDQLKGKTVDLDTLLLTDVRIDGGPMFKRIRPRARGMAFMVKRRVSHIKVTLTDLANL